MIKLCEALEEVANAEKASEVTWFKLQLAQQEYDATEVRLQKSRDNLAFEIQQAKNKFK